jgi:hypothetical protein
MTRALNVTLGESTVLARCEAEKVGVSATEPLPAGGTRLVCMSVDGAEHMRRKFKSHMVKGEAVRARHRPTRPLW